MGDAGPQNGHEGGGGARVSAAAAEGSQVGGKHICCVCMEPWTDSGAHRICCIPCGHVYGRSCLETWLSCGTSTSAKCPQCGKQFALEHIINLYALGNLWDRDTCTRCHIQAPVTSGPSASESNLCRQILDILHEPANIEKEHGVHVDEIVKRFKLPERKIMDAIMQLADAASIFCTIDDFHFKSTYNDSHPWAPVTSGPSAPKSNLWTQILDILHEPANIEKEHGVHVDEIVKRFKLPERKIMDAIMQLADAASIFCTIDDFHFKSTYYIDSHPSVPQTYYQQRKPTFQAPVTSGPSASVGDLCKHVLDILHEPASIEKEHGVHLDEIVKRFNLPQRKIMDAIILNIDAGYIYTTIDDYHFVAALE